MIAVAWIEACIAYLYTEYLYRICSRTELNCTISYIVNRAIQSQVVSYTQAMVCSSSRALGVGSIIVVVVVVVIVVVVVVVVVVVSSSSRNTSTV